MVGLTRLVLPASLWAAMETDVRQKYPQEACGILAGRITQDLYLVQAVYPMENILHSSKRFRIDPQQQLDCLYTIQSQRLDLIGVYHSHPHGQSAPSPTDQAENYDSQAASLIWHPVSDRWACRAYLIDAPEFHELPIEIQQAA